MAIPAMPFDPGGGVRIASGSDRPVPDEFAVGTAEVITIPADGGELEGDIWRSFEGND